MIQFSQANITISIIDLTAALAVSTIVGGLIVVVYRRTHKGVSYDPSLVHGLILVPPIVTVVMVLIGSNLALSLGMVGALSIIRFRTAIRDTRDMVFLFWSIAVGLSCGTYNWKVTIVSSLFLTAVLFLIVALDFGRQKRFDYVIVLAGVGSSPPEGIQHKLDALVDSVQFRSLEIKESRWEAVLEIGSGGGSDEDLGKIVARLKELPGVDSLSLLAPQRSLPL